MCLLFLAYHTLLQLQHNPCQQDSKKAPIITFSISPQFDVTIVEHQHSAHIMAHADVVDLALGAMLGANGAV